MEPVGNDAPWYTWVSTFKTQGTAVIFCFFRGLPFIPYIDGLDTLKRHVDGPFMMPIVDKYSEMGTVLIGKVRLDGVTQSGGNYDNTYKSTFYHLLNTGGVRIYEDWRQAAGDAE